jgi:cyclohexanecarboxylate-CoA ligase
VTGVLPRQDGPAQNKPAGATLHGWVVRLASHSPHAPALLSEECALSFAELHARALALAGSFHDLGIGRGDVVAAQLPNSPEFVLTYLATSYVGATLQTIHMPYRAAEISTLIAHSGAKAGVCAARLKDFSPAEFLVSLKAEHPYPSLQHVIAVGESPPAGALAFSDLDRGAGAAGIEPPSPGDRLLLLYTSGTTSAPKGVPVPTPSSCRTPPRRPASSGSTPRR